MKVDPVRGSDKSDGTKRRRQAKAPEKTAFREALAASAAAQGNLEIEQLFADIDESGRVLRDDPKIDNFKAYRERVARFIKLFLEQAYDIKLTSEMTLTGRQRHIVLVKKIDERLEEMYHLFLQEIFDIEELFKGIEEVRGMLLDLYR